MDDELKIKATEDSPAIVFERKSGDLTISGRSLPEDAFSFYAPVIDWIVNYCNEPSLQTTVHFNLEYFNTASSKQIFKIATLLRDLSKKHKVQVKWHYDDGDKDMCDSGGRFSKLSGIPFELIKN